MPGIATFSIFNRMVTQTIQLYKKAYGGLSPSTWWLSVVMLVNRSGTMVVPFMTMYMTQHFGVSIAKAGFVMSMFGLGAIVGALVGGKLTDTIGYYYVQIVTLVGGGLMFIILGRLHSYPGICIGTFFLALVNEAFRPANSVAIAHYSKDENRTRSYSLNRLAINLGWAVGGALGGIIASINYSLLFWVDGITNISASILLYLVLAPSRNTATAAKIKMEKEPRLSAYQDRRYLIFVILVFLFASCFFQLFTTLPVYYKEKFNLTVFFIGMIMAVNGLLISLVEMIIVFSLEGKRSLMNYISCGVLLIAMAFFFIEVPGVSKPLVALLSMIILTFGEILSMPFMSSYMISRTSLNNRGQYAALYTVSWASAQASGPFIGSLIAQNYGYHVLWIGIGILCILIAGAYQILK